MKLLKHHKAILEHRLSSGCIADVLADSEPPVALADGERVVRECEAMLEAGEIPEVLTHEQKEVLEDCLTGSTFFADIEDAIAVKENYGMGDVTRSIARAQFKAADELEAFLSRVIGKPISCARY